MEKKSSQLKVLTQEMTFIIGFGIQRMIATQGNGQSKLHFNRLKMFSCLQTKNIYLCMENKSHLRNQSKPQNVLKSSNSKNAKCFISSLLQIKLELLDFLKTLHSLLIWQKKEYLCVESKKSILPHFISCQMLDKRNTLI